MSKYFLPVWLPASLVVHFIFIVLLHFMPLNAAPIPGDMRVILATIEQGPGDEERIVVPPPPPLPRVPPPEPVKITTPEKSGKKPRSRGVVNPPYSAKPTGYYGAPMPTKPKGVSGPGTTRTHAVAPSVVHGGNAMTVPVGKPGGLGAHSDGPENVVPGGGSGGGETRGAQAISFGTSSYTDKERENDSNDGLRGTLVVLVTIDADGHVTGVSISRSSGSSYIDRAADRAARKSRFKPAVKNGANISSTESITYRYENGRLWAD